MTYYEIRFAWNAQADDGNRWHSLSEAEKVEWAAIHAAAKARGPAPIFSSAGWRKLESLQRKGFLIVGYAMEQCNAWQDNRRCTVDYNGLVRWVPSADQEVAKERAARQAAQAAQVEVAELKGRIARAGIEQRRAVLEEREACAKACEGMEANRDWVPGSLWGNIRSEMAAAIRARRVPEQPALLQSYEMMDEVLNMAGKVAICSSGDHKEFDHDGLFRFVAMVQAKEREECALACELRAGTASMLASSRDAKTHAAATKDCASAIRARQ